MESCFYETIHETDLLHVRFELQDAPAFVFPAHWHEYVEILYLIRGQFSAIVQATEYRLNEGDLIIINSGDLHMTRSNTCTYLLLQISASQMRQYLPDFDTMRFDTIIPYSEQPAPLRALLSEMNEIRQNPSDSYQLLYLTTVRISVPSLPVVFPPDPFGIPHGFTARSAARDTRYELGESALPGTVKPRNSRGFPGALERVFLPAL